MIQRIVCIALVLFALVGCSAFPIGSPVASSGSCGEIILAADSPRPTSAKLAEQARLCFTKAFRDCAPLTLTIRQPDAGIKRQFTIVPGATCNLRQTFQASNDAQPVVVDCASAALQDNKLVIAGCSHLGDFILTP